MELNNSRWEEFYMGSLMFQSFSNWSGLPIDQTNFLVGQLLALTFAYIFRTCLHPENTSPKTRRVSALTAGLTISYFCFGKQLLLALGFVFVCYLLLLYLPISISHHATLFTSMTLLSILHMKRQFYQDGLYVVDISGPLMLMVQRLTSVAYSYNDANCKEDKALTTLQRKFLVKQMPTMLEYFSYLLSFQSVLAGPYCMFTDYQDFIQGTHYIKWDAHRMKVEKLVKFRGPYAVNNNYLTLTDEKVLPRKYDPNPMPAARKKLCIVLVSAISLLFIKPYFPYRWLIDPAFSESSIFVRLGYIYLVIEFTKQLYIFGWYLGESISLIAGLGFNGYTEDGKEKWDLVDTTNFWGSEIPSNIKMGTNSWNLSTTLWLRFIVYERSTFQPLMLTYLLSSLWHGLYPGYFLTFFSTAFFTRIARTMRRHIRPLVVSFGKTAMRIYDVITVIMTALCFSYAAFPFVILRFWESISVYRSVGFYYHIIGLLAYILIPILLPLRKRKLDKVQ